ncbi:MAG: N-acetyltransferase [Polaromonas sp.]|nr:N-acetyltransferase [Polaromonas sp.]
MKKSSNDYVIRILDSPVDIGAAEWNALLATQGCDGIFNPFMRHEYLAALHLSGSATPKTGWTPRFVTLWHGKALAGACALYIKTHSYGEYVFDHAWAHAYERHGVPYYPKALVASPFTPVPGARLLARNADERLLLIKSLVAWCDEQKLSSLHLLFADAQDTAACEEAGLMLRHTVQFHWTDRLPSPGASNAAVLAGESVDAASALNLPAATHATEDTQVTESSGFADFDDFLQSLSQEKRKKIRQERRKVAEAGVTFRWSLGRDISNADWDFFYSCYERTYFEHGNAPYLSRDFFQRMQDTMPENWLMFVAEYASGAVSAPVEPVAIATSLVAISAAPDVTAGTRASPAADAVDGQTTPLPLAAQLAGQVAYGRYWGAVARVDCLHFEACYYQPLEWCIAHGLQRFEGGAQGEHKMARALLPVKTSSAHWLAHPSFADAVERFLEREGEGIDHYMDHLERRNPFRRS